MVAPALQDKIAGLCNAYTELLERSPEGECWYDARDIIELAKHLRDLCAAARAAQGDFDGEMLVRALRVNLQTYDPTRFRVDVVRRFMSATGLQLPVGDDGGPNALATLRYVLQHRPAEDALAGTGLRHLMFIDSSEARAALDLLRVQDLTAPGQRLRVITLSEFIEDRTPSQIADALADVKAGVEGGDLIALVNCAPLQSATYSLLNRQYAFSNTRNGLEAFVPMGVGAASRVVRVHRNTRIIYLLPRSHVRSTKLPFLNRFNKVCAGIPEALEERCVALAANPPPWLRAYDAADRKPFLDELAKGLGAFVEHCGPGAFHGLQPRETTAAVLYDALRANDDNAVFAAPTGFHDVSAATAAAAASGAAVAADVLPREAEAVGVTLTVTEAVGTLCKRLLQLATPKTVFSLRQRLPKQYL
jgi:hypothetical protein